MLASPLNPLGLNMSNLPGLRVKRPTLGQVRRRHALTQKELAEKVGVRPSTISNIEGGKRPGMKTIRKLAEALEIQPTEIDWPGDPLGLGGGNNGSGK